MVDAVQAQRARIYGDPPSADPWGEQAHRFALDPRRVVDPNLDAIAAYIQPKPKPRWELHWAVMANARQV